MTELHIDDLTPFVLVPEDDKEPLQFFPYSEMAMDRHKQVAGTEDAPQFFTASGEFEPFTFIFHRRVAHPANWRACNLIYLITGMVISVTGPVLFLDPPLERVLHLMKHY